MKEVAILLLVALLLNGCGSSTPTVQSTAGGTWEAQLLGGSGDVTAPSFVTVFTVNSNNSLNISSFEFLTHNNTSCFPINGGTVSGQVVLTINTNDTVSGPFTFTVQSNGNTLTLDGTVTGTAVVGSNNSATLTGATMTGSWGVTGGTGCNDTGGSFTMSQTTTT
jgi:hypothetical protein